MKKFTGKSLLGELSLTRILRKIGLSLIVVCWAWASMGQEAQETLEIKANDLSACYTDETGFYYEVTVSVRDFIKIDTFSLVLEYNKDVFDYHGFTGKHADLPSTASATLSVTEPTAGQILMKWGNGPFTPFTTIASSDNVYVTLLKLRFRIDGYPHTYGAVNNYVYTSALHWNHDLSKYWNQLGQVTHILTDWSIDGTLTVTQAMQDVALTIGAANCYNTQSGIVTVNSPTGWYSFNGNTWTQTPSSNVNAPSEDNTVRVRSGQNGGCISYYKQFDVDAPEALTFEAEDVYTNCPGGLGDLEINASGGSKPYTYYVIPETQWSSGDMMGTVLLAGPTSLLAKYDYVNNVIQVPAGSTQTPTYYWVAVQDNNDCAVLTGTNMMSWWQKVAVIDNKTPWAVAVTKTNATCFAQPDGRIQVTSIAGGTPFAGGKYNLWFNDAFKGKLATFDSDDILAPGSYSLIIRDSLACEWKQTYTITQPSKIEFLVDHTDASCNNDNGKIWILKDKNATADTLKGGTLPYGQWQITTDPSWATVYRTMASIDVAAENLPPGVYYARLYDASSCVGEYKNASGDNAIKVLDIDFDVVVTTPIKCNGGNATVRVKAITGAGNHTFKFTKDHGTTWQVPTPSTLDYYEYTVPAGTYWFGVNDVTLSCTVYWEKTITQPEPLNAVIVEHATIYPSCPGNSDGKLVVKAMGGKPFEATVGTQTIYYYKYKMDNQAWVQQSTYNTFAIDTARHTIQIMDANDCVKILEFDWVNKMNKIAFQDTIRNRCALQKVNLFNKWPEECEYIGDEDYFDHHWWNLTKDPSKWSCPELEDLHPDQGYLQDFEWYGIPNEHFEGTIYYEYWFWTSESGWVKKTIQGVQDQREPLFYVWKGTTQPAASDIVTLGVKVKHDTSFDAGVYWAVAMDEWGCFSNIEKIVILDPPALNINVTTVAAGCAGAFDGQIKITATNGKYPIPMVGHGRYQYFLTQQPQIFQNENWLQQVQWTDFTNGNYPVNDSLAVINVKKGTYWIAVRDYCAIENPVLIKFAGPIVVEGYDEVKVDWTIASVTNVTCNVGKAKPYTGGTPSNDGMITVPAAAVTGGAGAGSYTFKLEKVESAMTGTWPKTNTTGSFTGLWAGSYKLTVTSGTLACQAVYTKTITQPRLMELEMDSVYVSCNGEHDGILRYTITGGTMPYYESTNNGANWYQVDNYTAVKEGQTTIGVVFDRRVRDGQYIVWVKDSKDCGILKDTVMMKQPGKLNVALKSVKAVSCNAGSQAYDQGDLSDGEIKITPTGGWNKSDDFMYTYQLWKGSTKVQEQTAGTLAEVTFSGLTKGDYVVKMYEWDATNAKAKPYITYNDYFETWSSLERPYQNPDVATCFATLNVTVAEPALVTYAGINWTNVKCNNGNDGMIKVYGTSGGSGKYQYMVQGPADYPNNTVWYPATATSTTEWTWSDLTAGHYTVHVRDEKGCWIYKESGEIQNPAKLQLSMQLIDNVVCYKTATGKIKVNASYTGPGYQIGGFTYAIDTIRTYTPGGGDFPLESSTYLSSLAWQTSPEFMVKAGVWVGFVKDANGCVMGYAVDKMGQPVLNHRVTVLESTPVVATGLAGVAVKCNNGSDGMITFTSISGGNGGCYTARVWGVDVNGSPVDQMFYCSGSSTTPTITGLKATYTEGATGTLNKYNVVFYDSEGCVSAQYQVAIMQPKPFVVVLKDRQNAFICYNDKSGIFDIEVVQGGTPWPNGVYEYKWEAWKDAAHTQAVPELTGNWGFTKSFLGYAGLHYKVTARDYNGCTTSRDTFISQPAQVIITDIKDISCYNETSASARVTATAEAGRTLTIKYRQYLDENPPVLLGTTWTSVAYDHAKGYTDLAQLFTYSDDNGKHGHFAFMVVDNLGCESAIQYKTFNKVQNPLSISGAVTNQMECSADVALTVTGGIAPYTWTVDGVATSATAVTLATGVHTLGVVDAHLCIAAGSVTVAAVPFVGNFETTKDKLAGTNVKYPVSINKDGLVKDTTLAEGTHVITYKYLGCTRTMNVVVKTTIPMWAISTVQGTGAASPVAADKVGTIAGTVTAVVPGKGFYMQDASAAWSGIFVAYTTGGVLEGNGVKVTGTVTETESVTTMLASEVALVTNPTAITPVALAKASDAGQEMYESVLVKVNDKTRPTPVPTSNTAGWNGVGKDGSVKVSVALYPYLPKDTWYTITGVIDGKASAYTLNPRKEADIVAVATGVNPIADELEFKVYPNPFNDRIFIDNANKLTRVVVSNIAGQRVIDVEYPGHEIRTANLVSGVYVVSMFTEDGLAKTERIVKR